MGDWNKPTLLSNYSTEVLQELHAKDFDAASLFLNAPTNPITGMMKYVRADNKFQEYDGAAWQDKVLALAGGGTGAATAANARTNLGLGTIATQNSNNVSITGGSVSALILSGIIPLANISGLLNAQIDAAAAIAWTKISKTGSSLADLATRSASDLSSGTLPDARFPATLPAISGVNLTNLNASNLASGTVATARLGSGTADATTFLRGDGSWQVVDVQNVTKIEHLNGTIPSGSSFVDITCADVGAISKAYVILNGWTNTAGIIDTVRIAFTSTTNVRATRTVTSPGDTAVYIIVITYDAVP